MSTSPAAFRPDLLQALRNARHVVVLSGAGISAESGIPTFRDALTGLWQNYDALQLATPEAFARDPALVWGWYEWRRMRVLQASPNPAHAAVAALAGRLPRLTVVTQNVDDLHERAGSTGVIHLHGEIARPRCHHCAAPASYPAGVPDEPEGGRRLDPPRCARCGGPIRPGVVWFGEALPADALIDAQAAAENCELMLVIGTSGLVMPAAALPEQARRAGARILEINPQPALARAHWTLRGAAGAVLPQLLAAL